MPEPPDREAALRALEERLGHRFRDPGLLDLALTHASCSQEGRDPGAGDNQRLEFLGDAVAAQILSRILYRRHPRADEGFLTMARACLANRRVMARLAEELSLGGCLRLGPAVDRQGGRRLPSILGNAFEALIGALFLDAGAAFADRWLEEVYRSRLEELPLRPQADNPKGQLQEWIQSRSPLPLRYRMEEASGPGHALRYTCSVLHGGEELGRGQGSSLKQAERMAARDALRRMRPRRGGSGDREAGRRDPPGG